jgi:hypothetical protein
MRADLPRSMSKELAAKNLELCSEHALSAGKGIATVAVQEMFGEDQR